MGRIIFGAIIILIGLSALTGFSFFQFFFAILLIVIGVKVITGGKYHRNWKTSVTSASDEDSLNEVAIFSPVYKKIASDDFKGGSITMVFAGGEIDLSEAKASSKSVDLEITSVFGGGKLIIPKDWTVVSKSTAVFGGINNQTERGEGKVTLNLKGSAVFGGLEIVN